MKIGDLYQSVNFYGFAVNSSGVIGEVVSQFDNLSEIKKRYDASKIVNYICKQRSVFNVILATSNKSKNYFEDLKSVFKIKNFEPLMRGIPKSIKDNRYYPCFAYR